jgi:hypothetical protein
VLGDRLVLFMSLLELSLRVRCTELDPQGVAKLTANLRQAVLETDVDDATLASAGRPVAGAKSSEALAVGALVVAVAPVVLGPLMTVVSSWLGRQPDDVELEIDGHRFKGRVSDEERARLLAVFLDRADTSP